MSTLNGFGPTNLTAFSLRENGDFDDSIACDDDELVLIVVERGGSEPDCDGDCHSWGDVPCGLVGVFDVG